MLLKSLLALLPVLFAAETAPPPPAAVNAMAARDPGTMLLAADAETRWVPFDLTPGNQIRFAMVVNGRAITAILDTGVSYSVLAKGSAAAAAGTVTAGGQASAIGGQVAIGWMTTASVVVGGLTRTGGGVTVADLPAVATGSALPVDMLVGRDLVGQSALDIDYAQHRFRLLPSGRMPFLGATAPLTVSPARHIYESEISIAGHRLAPMVVDTGDGSAVTLTDRGWTETGVTGLPMTSVIAYGLAGPVVSRLAIIPALTLGSVVARSVEVRIEAADGFSQSIGVAGRIGSGFLQNYRVLLDPVAGRMVLSPGANADRPPLRSTSGLLLGVQQDRLRVLHVMAGGPAAAAGWHEGDMICTIDGQPIPANYPASRLATWSVNPPGTVVRLGLCDGTMRMLTLRTFY